MLILDQQTDLEWRNRLQAIQDVSRSQGITTGDRGGFKVARNGVKRSKLSILPEVHTFHASEVSCSSPASTRTITDDAYSGPRYSRRRGKCRSFRGKSREVGATITACGGSARSLASEVPHAGFFGRFRKKTRILAATIF